MASPRSFFTLLGTTALGAISAVWLTAGSGEPLEAASNPARVEVRFRILDATTGAPTPAIACLREAESHRVLLPPDGRPLEAPGRTREFYLGIRYTGEPSWIGPVRKMHGRGDNDDRSFVYGDRPSIPYWREPVAYQVEPELTVSLAPGDYHLAVARGMEFIPRDLAFAVVEGAPLELTVELERWVHLAEEGWFSGDVHVHHPTVEKAHRDFLLRYAEAEDIHLVNALEMGHHAGTEFRQAGFGKEFRVRRGDRWLVSGQEDPRSTFGHIIGLNTTAMARDVSTYDFYDLAFEELRAQGQALVGYAHFAWNGCDLPRGFPWYVTTEAVDFVELLQFGLLNDLEYADYLNLGFRLSAAGGSDIPWGSALGEARTYVHVGDELDVDAWFEGLRQGRTFVSNGPVLELTVDDELPGAELERDRGVTVRVRVRARGNERIGLPSVVELVGSPGIITRRSRKPDDAGELVIETEVPVDDCRWLAAKASCKNGALAHTSPVYLVVDGEPIWSPEKGPAIIDRQLEAIARIEAEFPAERKDPRTSGIRKRLAGARLYYEKLREAMREYGAR